MYEAACFGGSLARKPPPTDQLPARARGRDSQGYTEELISLYILSYHISGKFIV